MTDLGTLGGDWSNGGGLNDAGVVVGGSGIAGSATGHAFRWANGGMNDLGTLGGRSSFAFAINGSGQIVGQSLTAADQAHAFLWERIEWSI